MGSTHLTGIAHLSPSGSGTLVECERRYWWRYAQGLGRDERSEPMATGGGLAAALEHGSLDAGLADYAERRPVADGWTDPIADERARWIAEATIRHAYAGYLTRWPDDEVEREVTHFVRLPNVDRVLQVRIDGVAPSHLCEDKLRSGSSLRAEAIENETRQGRQLSAEIYAHWRKTDEIVPAHLRCVKKIDPRKVKTAESADEVETAIAAHFATEGVFNEWVCTRTRDQLLAFEAEFAALAVRAEALLQSQEPIGARNTGACHSYGRACPAIVICQGLSPVETGGEA